MSAPKTLTSIRFFFVALATWLAFFLSGEFKTPETVPSSIPALDFAIDNGLAPISFSPSAEFFTATTPDRTQTKLFSKLKEVAVLRKADRSFARYDILEPTDGGVVPMVGFKKNSHQQEWNLFDSESGHTTTVSFGDNELRARSMAGRFAVFVYGPSGRDDIRCKRINLSTSAVEEFVIQASASAGELEVAMNAKGNLLIIATARSETQQLFTNDPSKASFTIVPVTALPLSIADRLSTHRLSLDGLNSNNVAAVHFDDEVGSQLFQLQDTLLPAQLPFRVSVISDGGLTAPSDPSADPALEKQPIDALKARGVTLSTLAVLRDRTRVVKACVPGERKCFFNLMQALS